MVIPGALEKVPTRLSIVCVVTLYALGVLIVMFCTGPLTPLQEECEVITDIKWDPTFSCASQSIEEAAETEVAIVEAVVTNVLCVSSIDHCPAQLKCGGSRICADGSCSSSGECGGPSRLCADTCGMPCEVDTTLTKAAFDALIADVSTNGRSQCAEEEAAEEEGPPPFSWGEGQYIFFFIEYPTIPVIAMIWFAVNQRLSGAQPMKIEGLQQTGFSWSIPGFVIYFAVLISVAYCYFTLFMSIMAHYVIGNGREEAWSYHSNWLQNFANFLISWVATVVWTTFVFWPDHLRLHFLKRNSLATADYVRVFVPLEANLADINDKTTESFKGILTKIGGCFQTFMRQLYSDVSMPLEAGTAAVYKVRVAEDGRRFFTHRLCELQYSEDQRAFVPFEISLPQTVTEMISTADTGLSSSEAKVRLDGVGQNIINMEKPLLLAIVMSEFGNRIYIYMFMMMWTWYNFGYWFMGLIQTSVFVAGGISHAIITYHGRLQLYKLVTTNEAAVVDVLRDGVFVSKPAAEVVPGDVIKVTSGACLADAVLVRGQAIIDESSLTGEAAPVYKMALDVAEAGAASTYGAHNKKSTILSGTTVVQGGEGTLALVLRTGGVTDKGKEVGNILFKEPPQFKFDIHIRMFVLILFVEGIAFAIAAAIMLGETSWVRSCFMGITSMSATLPPLLPTVFVMSVSVATKRLATQGVTCSQPKKLLLAGKVRVCCFDKTGTITNVGMDFHGVRQAKELEGFHEHATYVNKGSDLEAAMAACHTLNQATINGVSMLLGFSVEKQMFEATGWTLTHKEENGTKTSTVTDGKGCTLELVRRFDFDHARQTSSVIVKDTKTGAHSIFVKGSAEAVQKTVSVTPKSYQIISNDYAAQGCYTLAIAGRLCTPSEVEALGSDQKDLLARDNIEKDCAIHGFLMFRNDAKPDSAKAMALLKDGGCRLVMLTGDHALTGLFMAREVGLMPANGIVLRTEVSAVDPDDLAAKSTTRWVDDAGAAADGAVAALTGAQGEPGPELVMLGSVFRELPPVDKLRLLPHVRVLARASPQDKLDFINLTIESGLVVSMCGDGGNDCGALRAAHVGIALSDAEASIVSPFTGVSKTCMNVVDTLIAGRGALATAFACFRYMIMYGQNMTLHIFFSNYFAVLAAEWAWAFMDGAWMIPLSVTLAYARPSKKLADVRPPSSLFGGYTMSSLIGMTFINIVFMWIALENLATRDWYQCKKWQSVDENVLNLDALNDSYEITTIFLMSGCQWIASAMAVNFGFKSREPWLFNWRFMIPIAIYVFVHIYITFVPSYISCFFRINCSNDFVILPGRPFAPCPIPVMNPWGTTIMPMSYRVEMFLLMLGNTFSLLLWEIGVVNGPVGSFFRKKFPGTKAMKI